MPQNLHPRINNLQRVQMEISHILQIDQAPHVIPIVFSPKTITQIDFLTQKLAGIHVLFTYYYGLG